MQNCQLGLWGNGGRTVAADGFPGLPCMRLIFLSRRISQPWPLMFRCSRVPAERRPYRHEAASDRACGRAFWRCAGHPSCARISAAARSARLRRTHGTLTRGPPKRSIRITARVSPGPGTPAVLNHNRLQKVNSVFGPDRSPHTEICRHVGFCAQGGYCIAAAIEDQVSRVLVVVNTGEKTTGENFKQKQIVYCAQSQSAIDCLCRL